MFTRNPQSSLFLPLLLSVMLPASAALSAPENHTSSKPPAKASGAKPAAKPHAKPSATPVAVPTVRNSAVALIVDRKGTRIGKAIFSETREGVTLKISVKSLKPGLHGIHVHETGSCEGPDFKSAGAHFNPGQAEHGLKNPQGAHAGDLPNIEIAEDGIAKGAEFRLEGVRLDSGRMGLFKEGGTALVIHADTDDQLTNPSGESGDRIACGVIRQRGGSAVGSSPSPVPSPSPSPAKSAPAKSSSEE